eukprot:scaffold8277_cov157-Isochrysis_galbana.AAC.3
MLTSDETEAARRKPDTTESGRNRAFFYGSLSVAPARRAEPWCRRQKQGALGIGKRTGTSAGGWVHRAESRQRRSRESMNHRTTAPEERYEAERIGTKSDDSRRRWRRRSGYYGRKASGSPAARWSGPDRTTLSISDTRRNRAFFYMYDRTNHTISPLFSLDAEGTLSMSEQMAKRLDIARIGHVGKNIRILSTDEQ